MGLTLTEALSAQTVARLKEISRFLQIRLVSTRKNDIVNELKEYLLSKGHLEIWSKSTKLEKRFIQEIVYDPASNFDERQFRAKYGKLPTSLATDRNHASHISLLIYRSWRAKDGRQMHTIPTELVKCFRKFVKNPPTAKLADVKQLPDTVKTGTEVEQPLVCRITEHNARYELVRVLKLIQCGGISVSAATKKPTKAAIKKCADQLIDGDYYENIPKRRSWDQVIGPVRAFAWPMILQSAKLTKLSGTKLKLTKSGMNALREQPEVVIRDIWTRWISNSFFDEFERIDEIKGQRRKGRRSVLTAASSRRSVVKDALSECSGKGWVSIDRLSAHIQAIGTDIYVAHDPWKLYVGTPQYGSLGYDGFHDWEVLEETYLLCLLFEYAATLGLVDIAYAEPRRAREYVLSHIYADELEFLSRYDGLQYIRLNPLGEYCLGFTDSYVASTVENQSSIRMLPNHQIEFIDGAMTLDEKMFIETFAVSETANLWRLDSVKCLEAFEFGHTSDELLAFLSERDYQPIPERTEGFLKNIENRASALNRIGQTVLYKCRDTEAANHISNDKFTKKYCRFVYGNIIGISSREEQKFRTALHECGYGIGKK